MRFVIEMDSLLMINNEGIRWAQHPKGRISRPYANADFRL